MTRPGIAALFWFLTYVSAFAQPDEALDFCQEKIMLEKETVRAKLEEYQKAQNRYLAYVKKHEDRDWSRTSAERKQQILDDIDFFRQPIEDLKKTEFTQEADCLDAIEAQRWATRALIVNHAGYEQGKITLQQIRSNWESSAFSRLRSAVEATEAHIDGTCVYVAYNKQATAVSCSSQLYVFSQSQEGRTLSKSIVRELRRLFAKTVLIKEEDQSTCHGLVDCYIPLEHLHYDPIFYPNN